MWCLLLLHTATSIKDGWGNDKLQKVNPHENQPYGITLQTAPDEALDPLAGPTRSKKAYTLRLGKTCTFMESSI